MSYAFDPELAPWVELIPRPDLSDVGRARELARQLAAQRPPVPVPGNVTVADADAAGVPVRIYTPADRPVPHPALLYLHGGGFVTGSVESGHEEALHRAADLGIVTVSVDYRLAPEHPFPAGLEDSYAALEWTADHAGELGIDPGRIAVGGDSAGGGLAASLTQLVRARRGPAIRFQYLGIPELDDRLDTPSMLAFHDTPLWNRPLAELSWTYYLGDVTELDGVPAAPARAGDLTGLPPAFVAVCEFDPLRDEGLRYAQRLLADGVTVELHLYPGTFHGCALARDAAVTRRMAADADAALRRALG
ncbi:alpha/beta hydrolase [Nocardia sp. BMG111209]|uniref:alpha/beta hydrolase n=1 Tax=Nocardia sp. BMG111209 TaxID=1160137 RepID=UPI00035FDB0A|nr:alpha/beta hydrolase [Nocardia sp. BMG111209]